MHRDESKENVEAPLFLNNFVLFSNKIIIILIPLTFSILKSTLLQRLNSSISWRSWRLWFLTSLYIIILISEKSWQVISKSIVHMNAYIYLKALFTIFKVFGLINSIINQIYSHMKWYIKVLDYFMRHSNSWNKNAEH